jgi:hypothetical protein
MIRHGDHAEVNANRLEVALAVACFAGLRWSDGYWQSREKDSTSEKFLPLLDQFCPWNLSLPDHRIGALVTHSPRRLASFLRFCVSEISCDPEVVNVAKPTDTFWKCRCEVTVPQPRPKIGISISYPPPPCTQQRVFCAYERNFEA